MDRTGILAEIFAKEKIFMVTRTISSEENNNLFAYENILFDEWDELRNYLFEIKKKMIISTYCYRGHSDTKWPLRPSIERLNPNAKSSIFSSWYRDAENKFIENYKRAIHLYSDSPKCILDSQNNIDWLSLMQHHGAASRLLDVSSSPFIAAFFALSDVFSQSKMACIWMFPLEDIDKINIEILNIKSEDKFQIVYDEYQKLELGNIPGEEIIGYSFLERPSERPYLQRGGFLYSMSNDKNFEELLIKYSNNHNRSIKKLEISLENRNDISYGIFDLSDMNISFSTLFPGLDGYTKDMLIREFIGYT